MTAADRVRAALACPEPGGADLYTDSDVAELLAELLAERDDLAAIADRRGRDIDRALAILDTGGVPHGAPGAISRADVVAQVRAALRGETP